MIGDAGRQDRPDPLADVVGGPSVGPEETSNNDDTPLAWEGRVFAVAIVWSLPGLLLGCFTCLFLPPEFLLEYLVGGGCLGATVDALLEAGYLD